MEHILCLYLLFVIGGGAVLPEVRGDAPPCEDLNTAACALFLSSKPNLCQDKALAANCQRFCGLCPLVCYDCPDAVNVTHSCNATSACGQDQLCMKKEHSYPDGTKEFILSCESKAVCEGLNIGFHNIIGKRSPVNSAARRDVNFHCCDSDLCNLPTEFTTTVPTTTHPTTNSLPTSSPPLLHNCSRDIVFILDGSTSIGAQNHYYMGQFVRNVINSLTIGPVDSLVAVVEYSDSARVEWYLNDHTSKPDLLAAAQNIPYVTGNTATHAAFWLARNSVLTADHGDRPSVPDVAILITDGGTTDNGLAAVEAQQLRAQGAKVIVIGVGAGLADKELDQYKASVALRVNAFQTLQYAVNSLVSQLC
ncbi:collagen alpha-1(XII) chain-like [Dreissena polymorpha]|uniref:Uncharacterized protein n=1 Tax=Dreissena polymorpha TaxID=45954 RepID=A0A9D3YJW9_DREPO|nr:collagen alpha-1(XII) chain-like [Dreissena polymorpha]KAH3700630.1 hypothetical protein DPMN_075607 [Dreissena polymorpha]